MEWSIAERENTGGSGDFTVYDEGGTRGTTPTIGEQPPSLSRGQSTTSAPLTQGGWRSGEAWNCRRRSDKKWLRLGRVCGHSTRSWMTTQRRTSTYAG